MCTGEVTVVFAAGVHMVTEGFTVDGLHALADEPVPVSETSCGLLGSESVRDNVPLRAPAAMGVNVTFTVQLAPAAILAPQLLFCEKSPLVAMEVMFTRLAVPFTTFTTCGVLLLPTFCAANVRLAGDTVNCGLPDAPVPESDAVCGLLAAESVSVSVPVRVPAAVGVNVTFTVQLAPAAKLAPQLFVWE